MLETGLLATKKTTYMQCEIVEELEGKFSKLIGARKNVFLTRAK